MSETVKSEELPNEPEDLSPLVEPQESPEEQKPVKRWELLSSIGNILKNARERLNKSKTTMKKEFDTSVPSWEDGSRLIPEDKLEAVISTYQLTDLESQELKDLFTKTKILIEKEGRKSPILGKDRINPPKGEQRRGGNSPGTAQRREEGWGEK